MSDEKFLNEPFSKSDGKVVKTFSPSEQIELLVDKTTTMPATKKISAKAQDKSIKLILEKNKNGSDKADCKAFDAKSLPSMENVNVHEKEQFLTIRARVFERKGMLIKAKPVSKNPAGRDR